MGAHKSPRFQREATRGGPELGNNPSRWKGGSDVTRCSPRLASLDARTRAGSDGSPIDHSASNDAYRGSATSSRAIVAFRLRRGNRDRIAKENSGDRRRRPRSKKEEQLVCLLRGVLRSRANKKRPSEVRRLDHLSLVAARPRTRLLTVAALAAFLCHALTTAAARAAPSAHTLRFTSGEEVATLNPDLTTQLVVSYLSEMTAAYAFRLNLHNELVPELATVVPTLENGGISKDGTTITLHLRTGVRWSDGAPFSADDVAFTIAAMNNPANTIPSRVGFDQITRVDEPDKSTLIVHLKAPYGAIVPTMFASSATVAILPKHELGSQHDINNVPFNGRPIGIGPFRYAAWKRGDYIRLERNPYYWRGRPALDQIIMKLIPDRNTVLTELQTGDVDMWFPLGGSYLARVKAIPNVHVIRRPSYTINYLYFNVARPVLADPSVRRALRYALDRVAIHDKVMHGVGILQNVVVPTIDPATPKDIPLTPFDPLKANAIFDAAGWRRGADGVRAKNGTRLSLTFASSSGTPDVDTMIELIRTNWAAVGAEISVQRYQSSTLFGAYSEGGVLQTGKFDVAAVAFDVPAPFDIAGVFGCKAVPPGGTNYMRFCKADLDGTDTRYAQTYDEPSRRALLSRALHILDRSVPAIVLSEREALFGVKKSIYNFNPNAATPFDDMMHVDVR